MKNVFFDDNFGVKTLSLDQLVDYEIQWLQTHTNIIISQDKANVFRIIAKTLGLPMLATVEIMSDFFKSVNSVDGKLCSILKQVSLIQSTTYEAVRNRLLKIDEIRHANIVSTAGTVHIYLILKKAYLHLLKENEPTKFSDDTKHELEISQFKEKVWDALYETAPVGTVYLGEITTDKANTHGHVKTYKFDLGKIKYAYIKAKYEVNLKNSRYLNIDSDIRKIYQRIINNNYTDMGLNFEYMDFHAPVNEIRGMHCIQISVLLKDDDTKQIDDNTIKDSDFKNNEDQTIQPSEFLDISCDPKRLAITIK